MKKSDIEKMISNMAFSSENRKPLLRLPEELIELVKRYSLILNREMVEYLQDLIDNEYSVISSKYIRDEDRMLLSELEIYKLVAIRNIYDTICTNYYKLVRDFGPNAVSIKSDSYGVNVSVDINGSPVCVYNFKYGDILPLGSNVPDDYKSMNIGTLNLYRLEENESARRRKLENSMGELYKIYEAQNVYNDFPHNDNSFVYDNLASQWAQKVNKLGKNNDKIDEFFMSDAKKDEIEVTKYAHDKIMEDLEISAEDFKEKSSKDVMKKVLVRQMPNLEVKDTIKYI